MPQPQPLQQSCILVLGMHRSGTSALAGVLAQLGVDIPATLMPNHSMNEKGFFESQKIYDLHEGLLASAGSSWSDWQPLHPGWFTSARAEEYRARAVTLLEQEFNGARLFVLKDPRMCRLLPFWTSAFAQAKIKPLCLHIHRNPLEVAASLHRRDGFDADYSNLLWMRHILEAEAKSRVFDRAFISYPQLLQNWSKVMDRAQKSLGITWPRSSRQIMTEVEGFLTADLQHHSKAPELVRSDAVISPWLTSVFAVIERWSLSGEDPQDHAALDKVRAQLDAAGPSFASLQKLHHAARRVSITEASAAQKDIALAAVQQHASLRIARLEEEARVAEDVITRLQGQAQELLEAARAQALALALAQQQIKHLEHALTQSQQEAIAWAASADNAKAEREQGAAAQDLLQRQALLDRDQLQEAQQRIATLAQDWAAREAEGAQTAALHAQDLLYLHQAVQRSAALEEQLQAELREHDAFIVAHGAEKLVFQAECLRNLTLTDQLSKLTVEQEQVMNTLEAERRMLYAESQRAAALDSDLAWAKHEINILQQRLAHEMAARQELYVSHSWRATAPLRWVSMRLAGMR